jgi:dTDP-4-amino-4,6-dideoxygalactose transaminase
MEEWHKQRSVHAEMIRDACKKLEALYVPSIPEGSKHAFYKCYIYVRPERLLASWSRDRIVEEIIGHGVPCYTGSCSEIYLEKAFDESGFRPDERLPVAKKLGETSLMFLVHPTLTADEIRRTCDVIAHVLAIATN